MKSTINSHGSTGSRATHVRSPPAAKRLRSPGRDAQAADALKPLAKEAPFNRAVDKRVLVVDVGGTFVKFLASGERESRSFRSGPRLTPERMVQEVKKLTADWTYDLVSVGYPGPVVRSRPIAEPHNLGHGWVGFDFARAFGCPVKVVNDAAMQALGCYKGGKMLFLGLGTGLGTAMIVEGILEPMELGHLPYKRGSYEHYVGRAGLERAGDKVWQRHVTDVVNRLTAALQPDETVLGGGNVARIDVLPPRCRRGDNANAFRGGFRLWTDDNSVPADLPPTSVHPERKARASAAAKPCEAATPTMAVRKR